MPKVSRKKASKSTDVIDSLGSPGEQETKSKEITEDDSEASPPPPAEDSNADVQETKNNDLPENDSYDIMLPSGLGAANTMDCTLMVEVSPQDASTLDYEGVTGAIGRFEANEHGVIVDLKGHRYQGSILPGPTALVVSVVKGGKLKAESITDEFVTLSKATNVMKSLDAIVKGQYDEGFKVREENVNKMAKQASADTPSAEEENKKGATTAKTKKRASVSSSKSSTKKKKKP